MDTVEKKLSKIRDQDLPPLVKTQQLEEVLAWAVADVTQKMAELPELVQRLAEGNNQAFGRTEREVRGNGVTLSDLQGEVTELTKGVARLVQDHEELHRKLSAQTRPQQSKSTVGVAGGVGLIVGAVLVGGLWWGMPKHRRDSVLLSQVHSALTQHYKAVPAVLQEQLRKAYHEAGYAPIGAK